MKGMKTTTAASLTPFEMLDLLGAAWQVTLTCLESDDKWQLHIASHPAPRWDESFSYTYRGTLAEVVTRAYEGEPDDGPPLAAGLCGDCGEQLAWCTSGGTGGCHEDCAPPAEIEIIGSVPS